MNGNGLITTWARGVGVLLMAGFIGWIALTTHANSTALSAVIAKQEIIHDLLRTSVLELKEGVRENAQRIRDLPDNN